MRVPETVFGATPAPSVRVLIVADTAADFRVAEAFAIASNEAGARFNTVYAQPPLAIEALSSPSSRFPQEILNKVGEKLLTQWKKARHIRITSDSGSDIRATIDPQYVHATTRPMIRGESFGGSHGGSGVIHLWPGWTTEGIICFDAVTMFRGRLPVPCRMTVEKGRVVKAEGGGEQVAFYEEASRKHRDASHFGEFGAGLNPKVQIVLDGLGHYG